MSSFKQFCKHAKLGNLQEMLKMAQIKGAENLLVYSRFSLSHLLPRCGHSTFLNLSDQVPFHLMILKDELLSVMMHERCMFLLDMKQISSLLLHCFIMRTFAVSLCAGGASAFGLMFLHWARKHLWFQHFLDRWYQLVMWTACLYGMYCLCWLLRKCTQCALHNGPDSAFIKASTKRRLS